MVRVATLAAASAVFVLVGLSDATAQCVSFSPTLPCSTLVPSNPLEPGRQAAPPAQVVITSDPADAVSASTPKDCGIVRPVDPNYRSAMPIIKPDESRVRSVIKTIPTPACRP